MIQHSPCELLRLCEQASSVFLTYASRLQFSPTHLASSSHRRILQAVLTDASRVVLKATHATVECVWRQALWACKAHVTMCRYLLYSPHNNPRSDGAVWRNTTPGANRRPKALHWWPPQCQPSWNSLRIHGVPLYGICRNRLQTTCFSCNRPRHRPMDATSSQCRACSSTVPATLQGAILCQQRAC